MTPEEKLKEQMAARKAENIALRKKKKSEAAREKLTEEHATGKRKPIRQPSAKTLAKKDSDELLITFRQLVKRLIDETKKSKISKVDWFDNESITRRKAQLSNIKDLISIVKSMREVVDIVIAEETAGNKDMSQVNDDKVAILEEARKALKGIGLNRTGL